MLENNGRRNTFLIFISCIYVLLPIDYPIIHWQKWVVSFCCQNYIRKSRWNYKILFFSNSYKGQWMLYFIQPCWAEICPIYPCMFQCALYLLNFTKMFMPYLSFWLKAIYFWKKEEFLPLINFMVWETLKNWI